MTPSSVQAFRKTTFHEFVLDKNITVQLEYTDLGVTTRVLRNKIVVSSNTMAIPSKISFEEFLALAREKLGD